MNDDTPLGPGKEFDRVRDLLKRWGDAAFGIGDDAALLDVPAGQHLVASADSAVDGVHFRRDWLTPREIGWRVAAAALSDLAAMAANPLAMLVSLSIPSAWLDDIADLADGLGDAARATGARIAGGDLTAARELCIAITVLGSSAHPLRRDGARAGDRVYVTGRLGGPLAALAAWHRGDAPSPEARARFAHPVPRLREAHWLAEHGARSAIDVSDGLLSDAAHIAAASRARLAIALDDLPTLGGLSPDEAARSGEEYELLVASPRALDAAEFARRFGIPLTEIGRVEPGDADVVATLLGARVAPGGGFDHFS
ncbi:MAG TPA: thiamine-phosphate kinase [Gemmatimonadaceae bacterium]|nr:thiamine-phosphate kinase [Gemmatimonadaceae bacterium]